MNQTYQYTRNLSQAFTQEDTRLQSFYCREDYLAALERYKRAPKDSRKFLLPRFQTLCQARGLDPQAVLKNPKLLEAVPTKAQLEEQLLEVFHELCRKAPSAGDYMERLVRQLAPEYAGDTVRLAILKKYILGAGFDCRAYDISAVAAWGEERMTPARKKAYAAATGPEKLRLLTEVLTDGIFCREHLVTELTAGEKLRLIRKMALKAAEMPSLDKVGEAQASAVFGGSALDQATRDAWAALSSHFSLTPAFEVDWLAPLEEALAKDITDAQEAALSAFVAPLEKCLTKLLKGHFYRSRTGKLTPLSEMYDQSRKDARKKKSRTSWELVKLCNDLAQGNFGTGNGQTRVNLYHFAMMLGMTLSLGALPGDSSRDIRKHLFEDYYCDNLTRFFRADSKDPAVRSGWEKEPTGDGINFKNFAEVIYLYYLLLEDPFLTPGQRIDRAEKKILDCLDWLKTHPGRKPDPNTYTQFYRDTFADLTLATGEDQLVRHVLDYYPLGGPRGTRTQIASDTHTAYEAILEALEELEDLNRENLSMTLTSRERRELGQEGLSDARASAAMLMDWPLAALLKQKYPEDKEFLTLVENIHSRLTAEFQWLSIRKTDVLIRLLQLLLLETGPGRLLGMDTLRARLQKEDASVTGDTIAQGAKLLRSMGFDLEQYSGLEESLVTWTPGALKNVPPLPEAESLAKLLQSQWEQQRRVSLLALAQRLVLTPEALVALLERCRETGLLPVTLESDTLDLLICWDPGQLTFPEDLGQKLSQALPDAEPKLLALLLTTLAQRGEEMCMLRLRELQALWAPGMGLKELGERLQKLTSQWDGVKLRLTDETLFRLGSREYDDPQLREILSRVRNQYYIHMESARGLLMERLREDPIFTRRITRTTLLAVYTSQYVTLLADTEGIHTFRDLYEDFTTTVNPTLEDCRFQPLHEKNVLDMYILLSLYHYVTENGPA